MKRLILTIIVLCSANLLYAQSPCEKAYKEAYQLYTNGNYDEAKAKFQLITKSCDSNKAAAELGIELCDTKLKNKNLTEENNNLKQSKQNLKSEYDKLKKAEQKWLNSKQELETQCDYYQKSYNKYYELYKIDSAEIVKHKKNIISEEIVAGNQEPTADQTKVCSENKELKDVLKNIYKELNEYVETSGFKNWLNSKNLKGQADSIREKIKPYIATSDTIQDVKPTEKPSEQIK